MNTLSAPILQFPIRLIFVELPRNKAKQYELFDSDSENSNKFANWATEGERASQIPSFTFIPSCDMFKTDKLNRIQRSEFLIRWKRQKNCGFIAAQLFDLVKPIVRGPVLFKPVSGTEPSIWNCC